MEEQDAVIRSSYFKFQPRPASPPSSENGGREPKRRAVIYCRASTPRQTTRGNSLDSQRESCRQYCHKMDYEVCGEFAEIASGHNYSGHPTRGELRKACDAAHSSSSMGDDVVFVVDEVSRISRSVKMGRLDMSRIGNCCSRVAVVCDDLETHPTSDPIQKKLEVAEQESRTISYRIRRANNLRKKSVEDSPPCISW